MIYLNDRTGRFPADRMHPFGTGQEWTTSLALGDMNGDGYLDIVIGNWPQWESNGRISAYEPSMVYLNDGAGHFPTDNEHSRSLGTGREWTNCVAVGDLDGDGFLDIVAQKSVYLNNGAGYFPMDDAHRHSFGVGNEATQSVAVGDVNGDGRLDIITGNETHWDIETSTSVDGQNMVYLNDGKGNFIIDEEHNRPFGTGQDNTKSVAVGDLNGDGHLDIVVGNGPILDDVGGVIHIGEQAMVYLNDGHGNFPTDEQHSRPFGTGRDYSQSVAIVDMNRDGWLDIITGNVGAPNMVYLNDGTGNFPMATARPFGTGRDATASIAVGDMNGDSYLDIVAGNSSQQNMVYLNDGRGNFPTTLAHPFGTGSDSTTSVVVGDLNEDGYLDIVTGNINGQPNLIYLNDSTGNFPTGPRFGTGSDSTTSVAVGDLDRDGNLDIISMDYDQPSMIYLNKMQRGTGLVNQPPRLAISHPGPTANADFFVAPDLLSSPTIPITYTLFDPEGDEAGRVAAFYSPDGGGYWLPAVAARGTITQHLSTAPTGETHTFLWDTFASGFFGQSDNVVVRLLAYSQPLTAIQSISDSYRYTNTVPGPYQWPYASAVTFPLRVRGTQVRVVDQAGQPLAGTLVYRLPAGQFTGAEPMADNAGQPYRTTPGGYLPGRGELQVGDSLVALLPVTTTQLLTFTNQYSYFLTSAAPIPSGLALTELREPGVLTLTVPTAPTTNTHPLLLYHLLVALEWDARADEQFMTALEDNFKQASELLFHVTAGQMALGQVDIVPAKSLWKRADLLLYAANDVRPSAAIGGLVNHPLTETVLIPGPTLTRPEPNAYTRGQVHMGVTWDPFGENTTDLGEQWWRALAHELSHYLLFLPDNYLGLKPDPINPASGKRFLGSIDCKDSFMTTTRDPNYAEFLTAAKWHAPVGDPTDGQQQNPCEWTLAAVTTGRSDWETITTFYPMVRAPLKPAEAPAILPLNVTTVVNWLLDDKQLPIPTRYFELRDNYGNRTRHPNAQVFLYQTQNTADPTDDLVVPFGSPTGGGDRIRVRGAHRGDRLCMYDFSDSKIPYFSCLNKLTGNEVTLPIKRLMPAQWPPNLQVSALTTRTLAISVTEVITSIPLNIQIFPGGYPATASLAPTGTLVYPTSSTIITVPYPTEDVFIRLWQGDSIQPRAEAIQRFFLQLPWQPHETIGSVPEFPLHAMAMDWHSLALIPTAISATSRMGNGGGDKMMLGGGDKMMLGGGDHIQQFAAPILSPDAQVDIYSPDGLFEPNGIKAIQAVPAPPELTDESWLTPVGSAFYVEPDPTITAPQKMTRAISFTYLQRNVPEGYEHTLAIYFLPTGETTWIRLATQQFVDNRVIADLRPEAGYYAIMSTIMLPPLEPGVLNPFIYPLPDCRMVPDALASLQGTYSAIYRVEPNGAIETNVDRLEFGKAYLLKMDSKEAVTPFLAPPRRSPEGELISSCH